MSSPEYEQKVVIAKKDHDCYECGKDILYGQKYLSYLSFPNYEFNPYPGKWTRTAFCYSCSTQCPEWDKIGGRVVARYTCTRCGADCNTLDQPHLCKDVRKRYERNAKAVELVTSILNKQYRAAWLKRTMSDDPEHNHMACDVCLSVRLAEPTPRIDIDLEEAAAEIVKALSGRDLGVD